MPKPRTVMVFGTFDILHKGHLSFFRQAKQAGGVESNLVVVVARDLNVKQAKGAFPINNEHKRFEAVKKAPIIDEAVLGDSSNKLKLIEILRPDIICLGYDQKTPEGFDELVQEMGISVVRLKPYKTDIFKSSKIRTTRP